MDGLQAKYELIYEDESIIVVNKPNNLLVHHSHYARNIRETSLAQMLRAYVGEKIYPAHRLDRKTSGVMLFGISREAAQHLQAQFENGSVSKRYLALVRGYTEPEGIIDTPIGDEKGIYKEAYTEYTTLEQVEVDIPVAPYPTARYSLVELRPKTGRTHQLRKHMAKIAHPIIGDPKYGNRHHNHMFDEKFGHSKLFLHATEISVEHPNGERMSFEAELPIHWAANLETLGFASLDK